MPPVRHRARPQGAAANPQPSVTQAAAGDPTSAAPDPLRWAEELSLEIEYRNPEELRPAKRNARKHSPKQIQKLGAAIREFGFVNPIILDRDGRIICGHGRVLAARQLGLKRVPVIRVEHLSEAQVQAYRIADNRLAELAEWDDDLLAKELRELDELEIDLDITGFDTSEIDSILETITEGAPDKADEVPDLPREEDPVTKVGDLWHLGEHRLVCGDAREKGILDHLLDGEQAQMVFSDPPYNCRISGHVGGLGRTQHREFAMASGEMSEAEFTAFLTTVLGNMASVSADGSIHFVCMDWKHLLEALTAGKAVYTELKNCCVWGKTNAGMGSFYRSQHELVLVFKHGTARHVNNFGLGETGRYRTNLWTYPGCNTFKAGRMEELGMHPTVKPVALVADAIRDCSTRHGVVLDAFGGSGTTLIAAERTRRRARLVELDRLYCDVIIRRWQKLTSKVARHAESGLTFDEVAARRSEVSSNGGELQATEVCHV